VQCSVLGNFCSYTNVIFKRAMDTSLPPPLKKKPRKNQTPMIIVSVIGKSVTVVLSSSPDGYSHTAACLLHFIYLLSLYEPVIFRLVEQQSIVFVCVFVHARVLEMFV